MKRFPWPVGGAGPQEPATQEVDAGPAVVPDSGPEQIWQSLSTEVLISNEVSQGSPLALRQNGPWF